MNRMFVKLLTWIAVAILIFPVSSGNAQNNDITIAVLPFENSSGMEQLEPLGKGLQNLIIDDLSKAGGVKVVERESMDKIIKEHALNLTGLINRQEQVRIGKILGAKIMLAGGFSMVDSILKINLHALDVETAQLIKSEEVSGQTTEIIELEKQLSAKLLEDLNLKINYLRQSSVDESPQVNLHFIRGLGYYYGCMYDYAIMEFMNALGLNSEYDDVVYWLARSYMAEQEYDHAKIELEKLIKNFPRYRFIPQSKKLLKECTKKTKGNKVNK